MFDNLTNKLQDALKKLRGQAVISESNIAPAMNDIRDALLEADVNIEIADEFVSTVSSECLGEAVLRSVTPGQQAVKIVYDKLVEFMGSSEAPLADGQSPNIIMMVGLHGSGKTTTSAKLALSLKKRNKKVMMVACDVYRPAAIDQLEILGKEIGVPVYAERGNPDVTLIAQNAIAEARRNFVDYLILDTAGRLQIDTQMVQELIRLRQVTKAAEILLVADAALGQQAVSVAKHFNDALQLTGVVLTKLDGDARGGAAFSIRRVTGCPIKFVGIGEKIENLDVFHPDRMASRILGMGDVLTLIEKAEAAVDEKKAQELAEKLKKNRFTLTDYLDQLNSMKNMGSLQELAGMVPGLDAKALAGAKIDEKAMAHTEAIILSMTPAERENPSILNSSRKRRIAAGAGVGVVDINRLLKQFEMMQTMARQLSGKKMKRFQRGGGKMPFGF